MMSTQAYYKERLGFDPADTVAEHQHEHRSQHGYEESLTKFKGQNQNSSTAKDTVMVKDNDNSQQNNDVVTKENNVIAQSNASNSFGYWGCWAKFIEAHGKFHTLMLNKRNKARFYKIFFIGF